MSDTIALTGNVATPPEHRRTGAGLVITSFRLATSHRRRDRSSGEWVDTDPSFYSVSVFRDLGEHAFASLQKGQRVVVMGKLKVREWETDAKKGVSVEIDAEAIGHDLRWGTSTFHPSVERAASAGTDENAVDETGAGDGWSTPGVDAAAPIPAADAPASAVESATPF